MRTFLSKGRISWNILWVTYMCIYQCVKLCAVAFFFLLFVNLVFPILHWFATYRIHGLIDYVLGRIFGTIRFVHFGMNEPRGETLLCCI